MTNKPASKSKGKKVLGTSLGKAPSYTADEPVDLSHVRKPIETSIFGLSQVLKLFETATDEVRRYVAHECDLIYECRICRTIFRSLANFILHKRSYCTESYRSNVNPNFSNIFQQKEFNLLKKETNRYVRDYSIENSPVQVDNSETTKQLVDAAISQVESKKKKDLSVVLNHLYDRHESSSITEQCLSEVSNESHSSEKGSVRNNIALQNLESSNSGVYQTIFPRLGKNDKMDFMKTEVMEIHDILENNEAILGIDGKILVSDVEKRFTLKNNYTCNVCNQKFSTKKTLIYHIRYKHNNSRLIYPCTECKETFATAWCVFRHLYKVHQKSTTQVRKLRNIIHDSAIRRSEQIDRRCNTVLRSMSSSEMSEKKNLKEQQWINNLEGDNDLQRCGGCGRKFERKAALHSHSQFCAKRIAVCNSIKESSSKKTHTEEKQDKAIKTSRNDVQQVERIRRRKPLVAQKICRFDYYNERSVLEEIIGPFPHRNDLLYKGDFNANDSKNIISSETTLKTNSCDLKVDDKQKEYIESTNQESCKPETFYIGTVVVSKVHCTGEEIKEDEERNIDCNEVQNQAFKDENVTAETAKSAADILHVEETCEYNELENSCLKVVVEPQESVTDVNSIPSLPCDINSVPIFENDMILEKETQSSTALENNSHENDEISATVSTQKPESQLNGTPKLKLSLTKKSLKYVNIEKQTCLPCKKRFGSYKSLKKHMAIHFSWYRYQCSICKYLSYTKSKCKHHAMSKHNICDKTVLNNTILHLPRSKTREKATNFINFSKRKSNSKKSAKGTITNRLQAQEISEIPNNSMHDNTQDPLVRQMIMQVIFGPSQTVNEEPLVNLFVDNEDIDFVSSVGEVDKSFETGISIEDEVVTKEVVSDDSDLQGSQLHDYSRPVRTRVPPLHKDFLYDMKHVLKRSKTQKLKAKVKLCATAIKHSEPKIKGVSYSAPLEIKTNESGINCVQLANVGSSDLVVKHVTGDYV